MLVLSDQLKHWECSTSLERGEYTDAALKYYP